MSNDVSRSVIEFLTAWQQAAAEASEDATDLPADLPPAIRGVGQFKGSATLQVPAGPVPAAVTRRLVQEAAQLGAEATEKHYAQAIGYIAFLFAELAEEAHVDVGQFLRRHALALAAGEPPYDDPPGS